MISAPAANGAARFPAPPVPAGKSMRIPGICLPLTPSVIRMEDISLTGTARVEDAARFLKVPAIRKLRSARKSRCFCGI